MSLFPLFNSLRISLLATAAAFAAGTLTAYLVLRLPAVARGLCDVILTLPLVLPPTVVGFVILVALSPNSAAGKFLKSAFGIIVTMRWQASVLAVAVIIFPLIYRTLRGAFEAFDKNLWDAGRTLGLSEWKIFWRIVFPNSRAGIAAGTVLAFARGLGEYGATSMVSGYIAGKTATVSTSVAYYWQINQPDNALFWVMVNLFTSIFFLVLINLFTRREG